VRVKTCAGLALALLAGQPAGAASVSCQVSYGGETQRIEAQPVASPYAVGTVSIGSFFRFRLVVRDEPADLAGIHIYTYADRDSGPSLIHQASYPYPPVNLPDSGFTGRHAVYEPLRDGELQYWCNFHPGQRT
jgi:hypothetical protein